MAVVIPPPGTPQRPLRIAVVGNSVTYMVVPPGGPDDLPFSRLLPWVLAERGVVAESHSSSEWFGMVHHLGRRYERIRDLHPDVVVLAFGMSQCQPAVLPTPVTRHFMTWNRGSHALARWYRRTLTPRLWPALRRFQRWWAFRDQRTHRLAPLRYRLEMQRVIERLRAETRALVLVLDIDPPGSRMLHHLPGLDRRVERYNALLHQLVRELGDPEVELVANAATVGPVVDDLLPDGMHRNAEGHRRTAELLADHVDRWLSRRTAEVAT